jgi:HAD superfamily hydrolase (TIGR01509 family)
LPWTSGPFMSERRLAALLFDIDGTLADTDHLHCRAFNDVLGPYGIAITMDEYKRRVMGFTNAAIMADFFPGIDAAEGARRADAKEARFRALVSDHIKPTPGLMALLDWADAKGIPMACVTNAPRPNAELLLTGLNVKHRFRHTVIGDDLPHGKPHPLPYKTGARLLGVDPADCIAFEDSRSGATSAVAAGCFTIGIMSGLTAGELKKVGASLAIKDFAAPPLRELLALRTA